MIAYGADRHGTCANRRVPSIQEPRSRPRKHPLVDPTIQVATRAALGAAGSGVIAVLAHRTRALTRSGMWAAVACGTVLYGAGGWPWVALIGAFFVTSSALTHLEFGTRSLDRGGRRWDQVAANGGVAAVTAAAYALTASPLALAAAAGAVAVATADTWATELGRLSRTPPRLITTGRPVPRSASGGVTPAGTLGAVAGAGLIAWIGAAFSGAAAGPVAVASFAAGISGAFLDSVLGATVEAHCRWVGSSAVNFTATAWGALVATGILLVLRR